MHVNEAAALHCWLPDSTSSGMCCLNMCSESTSTMLVPIAAATGASLATFCHKLSWHWCDTVAKLLHSLAEQDASANQA